MSQCRRKSNLIRDSHAVLQGQLKRIKNTINSTRYYVLFKESERGEARIEYYDEKNLAKPRKTFLLREIMGVGSKTDASKHEHAFKIHHQDDIIVLACANAEEKARWVWAIATLSPHGADARQAQELGCLRAWRVTVLPEGLYSLFHFQRCEFIFVLNEFTIELVDPDEHSNRWTWRISSIRNCGFDCQCFLFEAGTRSFSGNGTIWLRMASKGVAKEAHRIVLDQMSRGTLPDPETEASLQRIHSDQKGRILSMEARYGPQRPRGISEPVPPLPPNHPNSLPAHHRTRSQCVQSQPKSLRSEMFVPVAKNRQGTSFAPFQRYNSDPGRRCESSQRSPEREQERERSPEQSLQFVPSSPDDPPPAEEGEDEEGIVSRHKRNDSGIGFTASTEQTSYMVMHPVNSSVEKSLSRMSLENSPGGGSSVRGEQVAPVVKAAGQSQKQTGFGNYMVMGPRPKQTRRSNSKNDYEDMSLSPKPTTIYENHVIKTQ